MMNNSIKKRATRINTKTGFLEYADEPTTKVYVNNYDITEDDVLNRAAMMSTGVYTVDTPQMVIDQVATQNAAIAEAQRLAAIEVANAAARQAAVEEANRLAAQAAAEEQNRLWIAEHERLNAIRLAEGEAKAAEALRIREAEIAAQVEAKKQEVYATELVTQRSNTAQAAANAAIEITYEEQYQAALAKVIAQQQAALLEASLKPQATAVQMAPLQADSASNPEYTSVNSIIDTPQYNPIKNEIPLQQFTTQKTAANVANEVAENIVKEETAQRSQDDADLVAEAKRLAATEKKLGLFEQLVEYIYTVIYKQD